MSSTSSGSQFGLQLFHLFLQVGLLLLQFADGGGQSRHICLLRLLLERWGPFTSTLRFVLICAHEEQYTCKSLDTVHFIIYYYLHISWPGTVTSWSPLWLPGNCLEPRNPHVNLYTSVFVRIKKLSIS